MQRPRGLIPWKLVWELLDLGFCTNDQNSQPTLGLDREGVSVLTECLEVYT